MARYLRDCYRRQSVARVSEFSEFLRINRSHLSAIAARILGMALGAALRECQLRYAAHLLARTRLPVVAIARMAAFGTERSFYRSFRRRHGTSPAVWRMDQRNVRRRAARQDVP
jgi:AraC-like DNA-binding protein